MSDILFNSIPVLTDSALLSNEIVFLNTAQHIKQWVSLLDTLTDDERIAQAVADRLLGGSGLTLDRLQHAFDTVFGKGPEPTHLIMSPATRREYIRLLEADHRYSK